MTELLTNFINFSKATKFQKAIISILSTLKPDRD